MTPNAAREARLTTLLTASSAMAARMAGRKARRETLRDVLGMRGHRVFGALSALLFLPAAGCMATGVAPMAAMSSSEQHGAGAPTGSNADMCPVHVPGTTVEVADTQDSVALLFVTRSGNVAELRNRVRYLARRCTDNRRESRLAGSIKESRTG
jgi:hypothetical protein